MTTSPLQRNLSPEVEASRPPSSGASPLAARPGGEPPSAATPGPGNQGAMALARLPAGIGVPSEVVLASGETMRCGDGPPKFRVIVHSDKVLRRAFDVLALAGAYVEGAIDLEGDMWSIFEVRRLLQDRARMGQVLGFLVNLFLVAPTRVNRRAIGFHYTLGEDIYHSFIDTRYHL